MPVDSAKLCELSETAPETPVSREPFLGMRPFSEIHRELFFGREDDALRLMNKIFSGPLTVLYAPSGVGKTSLLRTLLIPALRADDNHTFYFDQWSESDPCARLKFQLLRSAHLDPRQELSLTSVVEAVGAQQGKPVVLVLDQFEHFLSRHGHQPDPLRNELAALIRSDLDAYVILSLREEYLGALEIFREHILTLRRSTYRLEHLDDKGVSKAIREPVAAFEGSCDDDLVEILLKDLRTGTAGTPGEALAGGYVELPILQVVCLELWRAARGSGNRLTLAGYRGLGGRDGIVRDYVRAVIDPLSKRQRKDAARILDYLAPHSGAKTPYAQDELVRRSKVPTERVQEAVEHLNHHCIVRIRGMTDAPSYELYHDASIRVLRKWVDEQLQGIRRDRRLWRVAAGFAALQLVAVLIFWLGARWHEENETTDRVTTLRQLEPAMAYRQANQLLDGVAFHLIGKRDSASIVKLYVLLKGVADLSARYYDPPAQSSRLAVAGDAPQPFTAQRPRGDANAARLRLRVDPQATRAPPPGSRSNSTVAQWPPMISPTLGSQSPTELELRIQYHPEANLNLDELKDQWEEMLGFVVDSLGVRRPIRTVLQESATGPTGVAQLVVGSGSTPVVFPLPSPDSILVPEGTAPSYFFKGDGWEWKPVGSPVLARWAPGGRLRVVPRWSLPAWKAIGQPPTLREKYAAILLTQELRARPDLLIDSQTIRRLALSAPTSAEPSFESRTITLAEAAVGGPDSLRVGMLGLLSGGRSIRRLPALLTAVAQRDHGSLSDRMSAAWREALRENCASSTPGSLSQGSAVEARTTSEVEDLQAQVGDAATARERVELGLCHLESLIADQRLDEAQPLAASLFGARQRDSASGLSIWGTRDDYVLGFAALAVRDALGFPTLRNDAIPLLTAAFARLDKDTASPAYSEIRRACLAQREETWSQGRRWCWDLLYQAVQTRPENDWLALSLGYDLSGLDGADNARRGIELLDRGADRLLAEYQGTSEEVRIGSYLRLGRARASLQLAQHGDSAGLGVVTADLEKLAGQWSETINGPSREDILQQLRDAYLLAGRSAAAESTVKRPGNTEASRFYMHLVALRSDSARILAERASRDSPSDNNLLFVRAMSQLLLERPGADSVADRFLRTDHNYGDYIRFMLAWYLRRQGRHTAADIVLQNRWKTVDSTSWQARLDEGDQAVWREMLVGYFARAVDRQVVFRDLEHPERFAKASLRLTGFPLTGLRCEAYFYDALRNWDRGPSSQERDRIADLLSKAIATKHVTYYEYHLARLLAGQLVSGGPIASKASLGN